MKQWIFTAALSISLVCGHLEAAGGEYSIRKEQAGQEQAVQTQEVQGRAVQTQEVQGRAVQAQEVQSRAVQVQEVQSRVVQVQEAQGRAVQAQEVQGRAVQVQEAQNRAVQNRAVQTQEVQGRAVQTQAVQVQEAQSRAVQVQAVQSRAGQTQSVQAQSGQAQASQTENADFLKLYAQSAVLMDGSSGRILYGKGQDIIRPMASTTKIMTCILALELGNLDDKVTASSYAASQPKVHLGVRSGEEYRLEDLLYALMLESYNDAAVMIAENIGGSVEDFAALMNQKAEELGCRDTYFITPNGLDGVKKDKDGVEHIHSTTAADLAAIMRYSCFNHNAFLNMMEGVLSGKTGFTGGAGYSYVGAMENDGRTYVIALLGCGWPPHKTYKWADARKLYTYGLEHFRLKDVFREEVLPDIPVTGGLCWEEEGTCQESTGASLHLKEEEMHLPLLLGEDEEVQVTKKIPAVLQAPVREGQKIGTIDYSLNGTVIRQYPVYADRGVDKMTFSRVVWHILGIFMDFGKTYHII